MNVLYIGASGLVGSHAVPFLAQDFNLTLTGIAEDTVNDMPVLPLDITQWHEIESFVQKGTANGESFDAIVYCATANYHNQGLGIEGHRKYYEKCIEVNMRGAYHVFEAAKRAGVPRVVHIGSMTSFLGSPHYEYIDIDSRDRPNDLYAATKIFGENVGYTYAYPPYEWNQKDTEEGMQVICLRLGQPFIDKKHWREQRFRAARLPVHMEDIAQAVKCALVTDIRYGVYAIVSDVEEEDRYIDPELYEKLGYKPLWKFSIQLNRENTD